VRERVVEADHLGCREGDICYPPQTTTDSLQLGASARAIDQHVLSAAAPAACAPPVSEQSRLARLLVSNPAGALLAFFVAGLLLAFTPCVFPMVPILSGIIAGEGDGITTRRAFWLSLVYVLAMAATYTVAGVLAGLFGKNLQAMFQNPWVISAFAALFVLLALSMFGLFELQLPHRFQTAVHAYSRQHRGGKLGGVAILGVLSALIVGPCVAPPLAAALIVIGDSGNPLLGGSALFSLSLGMGAPLILFGVLEGKYLPRAGAWMETVKAVFGVGLLALAIWMLERIIQGPVILALWGLLAIGCGVFLRALDRLPEQASPGRRLARVLGLVLLLVGAAELVGALSGGKDWLRPLQQLTSASGPSASHVRFQRVKSSAELHQAVSQAATAGKPTMLDFYADWCVECIRMERNTFPDADGSCGPAGSDETGTSPCCRAGSRTRTRCWCRR
jgi:thiol:disulfide interchange protein DsbD